jgi:hypothetical protein
MICVYHGSTLRGAKLIATTVDPGLCALVVERIAHHAQGDGVDGVRGSREVLLAMLAELPDTDVISAELRDRDRGEVAA